MSLQRITDAGTTIQILGPALHSPAGTAALSTRVCGATYSSATYDATLCTQWRVSEALQKISVACHGHQSRHFFGQLASEWSADVHCYTVTHFFDTELFVTECETSPAMYMGTQGCTVRLWGGTQAS